MNYYIQGDAANADKIKAAFEKLGYDTSGHLFSAKSVLYFTLDGRIRATTCNCTPAIIKTHPDYKELELPVEPKFKVGDKVIYKGNVRTITFMDEVYYDFDGGVAGCRIEKQDELLSAAPKFKIGDWIACDADSFTLSIKSVKDGNYYFHQGASLPIKDIDEHYHLWTIADAKDGDIIGFNDCTHNDGSYIDWVGIYKEKADAEKSHFFHCVITSKKTFRTSILSWRVFTAYPATKEQRDLLFQKMKEAGYQWDADKKELKKIQPHYDISNFKPFDKVLVRCSNDEEWMIEFYCKYDTLVHTSPHRDYPFMGIGDSYSQCIPFDGNEHLLGTTDMCDEQYINW